MNKTREDVQSVEFSVEDYTKDEFMKKKIQK